MKHWRDRSLLASTLGKVPVAVLLALASVPALEACSSVTPLHDNEEDVGSLGLNLEVAPGVTLNSVEYVISGNNFEKSGTIDSSGATRISGTVGGIPAGNGYTITLTAVSVED